MKTPFLAVMLLAFSSSFALATEDNSLSGKEMQNLPAKHRGFTAFPTIKPDSGSLSEKVMNDHPGVNSDRRGFTFNPTVKPFDSSLAAKTMRDNPAIGR